MKFASGNHKVAWHGLLQDEPHALNIVAGIAPVTLGIEISQVEFLLKSVDDARCGKGYLASDECLATTFTLVVEEDAVGSVHAVAFAVVLHNPVAVKLSHRIRATRVKWSVFVLGYLLNLAIELAGARLINLGEFLAMGDAHGFKQSQSAHSIGLGSIFWHVERHLHMALRCEVVNLIGLDGLD